MKARAYPYLFFTVQQKKKRLLEKRQNDKSDSIP